MELYKKKLSSLGVNYSLIWSTRGMCHWTGSIFALSVLNRVYNFVRFCPNYKQDIACTIDLIC